MLTLPQVEFGCRDCGRCQPDPQRRQPQLWQHKGSDFPGRKGHESFVERDAQEEMRKSRDELNLRFGGEEEADKHIKVAKSVLNQYAKESDKIFVADSGLGNSPEFIELLSKIGAMLSAAREKENRK